MCQSGELRQNVRNVVDCGCCPVDDAIVDSICSWLNCIGIDRVKDVAIEDVYNYAYWVRRWNRHDS